MTENRGAQGKWLAGVSPNPGGRPKIVREIRELAADHGPAAFQRVLDLVKSPDPRIALAASTEVLNRAYGKPMQSIESKVEKIDIGAAWLAAVQEANEARHVSENTPKTIDGEVITAVEW